MRNVYVNIYLRLVYAAVYPISTGCVNANRESKIIPAKEESILHQTRLIIPPSQKKDYAQRFGRE